MQTPGYDGSQPADGATGATGAAGEAGAGAAGAGVDGAVTTRSDSVGWSLPGSGSAGQADEHPGDRVVLGLGHPRAVLGLHGHLAGHVGAPEALGGRQPGRGVTVGLLRVERAVHGEQVEGVVGEREPARRRPLLGALLPGVGHRDDVVHLHVRAARAALERERAARERVGEGAGQHDAAGGRRVEHRRRSGRDAARRCGCRSRCGRCRPSAARTGRGRSRCAARGPSPAGPPAPRAPCPPTARTPRSARRDPSVPWWSRPRWAPGCPRRAGGRWAPLEDGSGSGDSTEQPAVPRPGPRPPPGRLRRAGSVRGGTRQPGRGSPPRGRHRAHPT